MELSMRIEARIEAARTLVLPLGCRNHQPAAGFAGICRRRIENICDTAPKRRKYHLKS
jgi:hypothetical protein